MSEMAVKPSAVDDLAVWPSLAVGALAGGAGSLLGALLSPRRRLDAGAIQLAFIAGAYPAMALHGGSRRTVAIEFLASGPFVGLAVAGLGRRSRLLIAGGLIAHAAWDAAHHLAGTKTHAPRWFPAFCMAADIALAAQFALGAAK